MVKKYSKEPANPNAFAKARADNVRVSFKNTMNVGRVLQGMSLRRSKKFLNNVLRHSEAVPLTKYNTGRARHAQGNEWKQTNLCSFPTKSIYSMLKILRNAEANAKAKGLESKSLFLSHVQVNKAPPVRRRTFRAHGRIGPYQAHPSHIEIILSEKVKVTSKPEPKE
jgi:large subunit ribosomal protein L17e